MNHERTKAEAHRDLLTLRNFLLDLPHSKFHMPAWTAQDATEISCGTAGCAAGWAATIFHKKGWTLRRWPMAGEMGWLPEYGKDQGSFAFATFFMIKDQEADYVCSPFSYRYVFSNSGMFNSITPTEAAGHITEIGKKHAPELAWDDAPAVNDLAAELALHTAESTGVEALAIERAMSDVDEEALKASVLSRPDRFEQE
jgi:hypothetical protein